MSHEVEARTCSVLTDTEILALREKVFSGQVEAKDWYTKDSAIQPASVDLTVGKVFLPCPEEQNQQSDPVGREDYILEPGHTAIVMTAEEINMPKNLIALGFPPNKVSVKGILMTNPGQVDPGYSGPLRFTVINMGSKAFSIRKGDPIVSLVLIRLEKSVTKDWLTRNNDQKGKPPGWTSLNSVSSDFVNVEERSRQIASTKVKEAGLIVTLLAVALPLIINGLLSFWGPGWKDPLTKAQQDIAVLQSQKNTDEMMKQFQKLQAQVQELQDKLAAMGTRPQAPKPPVPSKPKT